MSTKVETTDTTIKLRSFVAKDLNPCNEPGTCLWCGERLRLKCDTTTEDTDELRPPKWTCCDGATWLAKGDEPFECSSCGNIGAGNRKRRIVSRTPSFQGGARGDYGDNAFCGLRCGYAFGVTMARFGHRLQPVEYPK